MAKTNLRIPHIFNRLRTFKGRVYLVGGPVRDMLLGKATKDLDFLIEGGPRQFSAARTRLLSSFPAKPGTFRASPFLTCMWESKTGFRVDCARPRAESYPKPASLPKVHSIASIEKDMVRRDFAVNAMALGISGAVYENFVDPLGGRADLERRLLRTLHARSFEDDPTRMLRLLRLAVRLDFDVEETTFQRFSLGVAGGFLGQLTWERLRDEWLRAFDEPRWIDVLRRFLNLGILADITPNPMQADIKALEKVKEPVLRFLSLYASVLFKGHDFQPPLSRRNWPSKELGKAIEEIEMLARGNWRASRRADFLTLGVLRIVRPEWAKILSSKCPCLLDGRDLRALQVPPEKRSEFQKILMEEALKGKISSRREASVFVKESLGL